MAMTCDMQLDTSLCVGIVFVLLPEYTDDSDDENNCIYDVLSDVLQYVYLHLHLLHA